MIVILVDVEKRGNVYILTVDVPPYPAFISSVADFHKVTDHVWWLLKSFTYITDRCEIAIKRIDLT